MSRYLGSALGWLFGAQQNPNPLLPPPQNIEEHNREDRGANRFQIPPVINAPNAAEGPRGGSQVNQARALLWNQINNNHPATFSDPRDVAGLEARGIVFPADTQWGYIFTERQVENLANICGEDGFVRKNCDQQSNGRHSRGVGVRVPRCHSELGRTGSIEVESLVRTLLFNSKRQQVYCCFFNYLNPTELSNL
ncbi:unnamed protein product [Periconia digitata]|uniref:Uncharacterized protein n=1 Tax=Periconia digitata TaxID=1303443 RepID=A0A9W4U0B9_9PLEO|nr:unnamed protein product [Periconia digitata]